MYGTIRKKDHGYSLSTKEALEDYSIIEYKVIKSVRAYETFMKIQGLWRELIDYLYHYDGNSKEWWEWTLKKRAGFGIIITVDGKEEFIPRHFSWTDSTQEQRSKLVSGSISFLLESGWDIFNFMAEYSRITGRELI
jgi:hypothetical protein